MLPWNTSATTGFAPAAFEQTARGPSAVCLDSEGRTLVLNALSGMLTRLDRFLDHERLVAVTDPDFADLSCAGQSLVLFSALRSRALVLTEDGSNRTEIAVPRAIRRPNSVDMRDGDLWLSTALQERWRLSRSLEPLPLAAIQNTREEGFPIPGGGAVAVAVRHARPVIFVLSPDPYRKSRLSHRLVRRLSPDFNVDALSPIWASRQHVCLLAERRSQDAQGRIRVSRSVECLDLQTGSVNASLALPPPGIYAPRRWLAMRRGVLAVMVPRDDGLHLDVWRLEVAQ